MAFDFKKEYRCFYLPSRSPELIEVPEMHYLAVRGKGNPNTPDGDYQQTLAHLYALAYTIKMSGKGEHQIEGFFDYVVPPLEGFWWQDGVDGIDYGAKDDFCWISVIRLPDFASLKDFEWASAEVERKKGFDCSKAEYLVYKEGLCVQCLHQGPFDTEKDTVALMDAFIAKEGYQNDITDQRYHHEIYLSDPRRVDKEKLKTVIRHPIRRK